MLSEGATRQAQSPLPVVSSYYMLRSRCGTGPWQHPLQMPKHYQPGLLARPFHNLSEGTALLLCLSLSLSVALCRSDAGVLCVCVSLCLSASLWLCVSAFQRVVDGARRTRRCSPPRRSTCSEQRSWRRCKESSLLCGLVVRACASLRPSLSL